MRRIGLALALACMAGALPAKAQSQTRCGWFVNPTPGNFYLTDAEADWWFAAQGAPAVDGWDSLDGSDADFGAEWVATNGAYGYGCACVEGAYGSAAEGQVWSVARLRALPLRRCLADPALPAPPRD